MRPVQKTLVDFNRIDRYAELLHSPEVAKALREAKQTLISMYDRQASNYSVLVTSFEDCNFTVAIVKHDYWL